MALTMLRQFGGFFSGFTFEPEIAFERLDLGQSQCLPNITLSVSQLTAFDQFQWYFNDSPITGATLRSFTPTQPGYYHVAATISACPVTMLSHRIPVSMCAADSDNDDINNNLDLDNDNDGITNCEESGGSFPFNLTNSITDSSTFTGSFPTPVGVPSANAFIGSSDGSFVTEVSAGKGNTTAYQMNYNVARTVEMSYANTATSGQEVTSLSEFVVSVPPNRTISVSNPTNQLLIDTNFDGIFESGITEFSAFEIRFRFNISTPLPAGSGTFSFRSSSTESFRFLHRNLTADNEVRAKFMLSSICNPVDSDQDSVPDQFDFDSDNDGIPDIYESQGFAFKPLSFLDVDRNGIDDVFENGVLPADSDTDGVPDYLDWDSDNNGIFDVTESGNGFDIGLDNGSIYGTPFGSNGIADILETSPDSGILNYSLRDADADGVFDFVERDNDNDLCDDVIEANFEDPDNDGYLSISPVTIDDETGLVFANDGYNTLLGDTEYYTPAPIVIIAQPNNIKICELQPAIFSVEVGVGVTVQWQYSTDFVNFSDLVDNTVYSGTQTSTLTILQVTNAMDDFTFRAVLSLVGNLCGSISEEAVLQVDPLPAVVTKTLVQCDTGSPADGISTFNLSEAIPMLMTDIEGFSVEFYQDQTTAEAGTGALPEVYVNTSNPQTVIAKITNDATGCFSFSTLILNVNNNPVSTYIYPPQCDTDAAEDGFFTFDLTLANFSGAATATYYETENDALLEQNPIADATAYVNTSSYELQTLFARQENTIGCSAITKVNLLVNRLPAIDTNAELINHVVCTNESTFTTLIDAALQDGSSPENYDYQWSFNGAEIPGATNYSIEISEVGTYTVTVTDENGCSKVRTIPVISSSTAIITDIEVGELSDNNTIVVTLSGNSYGDYVYSLDYENAFQLSNIFNNVLPGIHTVFVRDVNGCATASIEVAVLGIPTYFTPNGDGFNDTWNVKGVSSFYNSNTEVRIFDRYGKLLKQIGAAGLGWDGTFNGEPLPSDDYWYVVKFEDGRTFRGHFSLKR
jgi:gliding motility-associated-like protein